MVALVQTWIHPLPVFSPGFFDRIWGHTYSKPPMQRAHHPHTSIHGKSVPHLGQCLSFFAWIQQDTWPSQLGGVDNYNELHCKIKIMHSSRNAFRLEGIWTDMFSDWKGYGPDILKQPGENTAYSEPCGNRQQAFRPSCHTAMVAPHCNGCPGTDLDPWHPLLWEQTAGPLAHTAMVALVQPHCNGCSPSGTSLTRLQALNIRQWLRESHSLPGYLQTELSWETQLRTKHIKSVSSFKDTTYTRHNYVTIIVLP